MPRTQLDNMQLPIKLYPSRRKAFFYLAIAAVVLILSFSLSKENLILNVFVPVYLVLGIFIIGPMLRRDTNYLELDREHFCIAIGTKKLTVQWRYIAKIGVQNSLGEETLGWVYTADYPDIKHAPRFAKYLSEYNCLLDENYGMDVEKLAELMSSIAAMDAARRAGGRLEGQ